MRSIGRSPAGAADRRRARLVLGALAAVALAGLACGSSAATTDAGGSGGPDVAVGDDVGAGDVVEIEGGGPEGGACTAAIAEHPNEGAIHVDCTPVPTYKTNPPSSGNHYQIWADYQTYDAPVPWGHLVHSLEHGAIVIVYNCPDGCPDEVAAAQAMIDALPVDPLCTAPTKRRVILAPDPMLDVRWAASAWTWTLRSTCFDAATFSAFASAHYAMGGENFCTELHEPFCAVP